MRGASFHNSLAQRAQRLLERFGWQVWPEKRFRTEEITTYIDLYATKGADAIACEIETTDRHVLDNARKAAAIGLVLWVIVPTRTIKRRITCKLEAAGFASISPPVNVLLFGELEAALARRQADSPSNSGR